MEPVLKYGLCNPALPGRAAHQRHHQRLHICGKSRIRRSRQRYRAQRKLRGQRNAPGIGADFASGFPKHRCLKLVPHGTPISEEQMPSYAAARAQEEQQAHEAAVEAAASAEEASIQHGVNEMTEIGADEDGNPIDAYTGEETYVNAFETAADEVGFQD